MTTKRYTLGEEIANSITHGVGAALSIAGLVILVTLAAMYGDAWRVVSFSIYGASLILLYLFSTLYHAITNEKAKKIFRVLDHSSIYILIAGTYMPMLLVKMRDPLGWTLFGVVVAFAILGIVYKAVSKNRYSKITVVLYAVMGLLSMIAIKKMYLTMGAGGVALIATGGLIYLMGIGFYAWKRLPYNHMIWHLFVLAASICHFFAFLFYVLPQ